MKKYMMGLFAALLGVALAIGTSSFKNHAARSHNTTEYYYEFSGSHGQESTMSLWLQLPSASAYNSVDCDPGSNNSCKIINTTNSGSHPTAVPLDNAGFPEIGTVNTDRELKD